MAIIWFSRPLRQNEVMEEVEGEILRYTYFQLEHYNNLLFFNRCIFKSTLQNLF